MTRAGLPIAAYLAALVALALAAAFVAVVAVVLWLPPRPPDVMRADIVADQFAAGYDYMRVNGRPIDDDMDWAVRRAEPESNEPPRGMVSTQHRLAGRLRLHPDQVRITAAKVARSDVMVFRVREAEVREHARHAVRAAREAMLEARRNNESEDIIRAHEDVLREAQAAAREAQAAAREALSEVEVEAEVGRDMETRRLPDREPPRAPLPPDRHAQRR
jgi:hypothetical protein